MKHVMHKANDGQFRRGGNHPNAKLTEEKVLEIRRLYQESNVTQKELGEKFGVANSTIWRIINRFNWEHV